MTVLDCFRLSERLLFKAKWAIFFIYIMTRTSYIQWDDSAVRFILDQQSYLDFYTARLLKQQYTGRHVAPLIHINLIQSQSLFTLTP